VIAALRAAAALYRGHLRTFTRSRTAIYWTLAFPLFFLAIFGLAFSRSQAKNFYILMPGLFTITVISGSLFGVSLRMVTERETGVLRRYRLTPIGPASIVLAHGAMAFTTLGTSILVQATVAWLAFGFHMAGTVFALALVIALGGFALIPFGLLVGSIARDTKVAPAMTNFLMFPLMFLSGSAIPYALLPPWMQRLGRVVPTTYLVESLQGVIVRGVGPLDIGAPVLVLLLTGAVGITLNVMLFRWESTERIRGGRILFAAVVLGLVYGAEYVLGPSLHIAQK